jgi:hypothetical protein
VRRSLAAACAAALLALPAGVAQARQLSLAALMPVPSAASAGAGAAAGTYVPLPSPTRVVDTSTGAGGNRRGALRGGHSFAAMIAGRAAVPAAAGTGSVLLSVSASKATAPGSLVVWGAGGRPDTANVQFTPGPAATDTAVVQPLHGRLWVGSNAPRGTVQVAVDVLGYFVGGRPTAPGTFEPVLPRTVADTGRRHALGPGKTITPSVAGSAGAARNAGAVAVTITVSRPRAGGTLLAAAPSSPLPRGAAVEFAAGRSTSAFAVLPVSGGRISLTNTSPRPADVAVDVDGYFSAGIPETAHAFRALDDARIVDHAAAGHALMTVATAGRAGMPLRNVAAALVTVRALDLAASGALQVWRAGARAPRRSAALSFTASHGAVTSLLVPLSPDGEFVLRNESAGRTRVQVDVRGYVPANGVPVPGGTASARYLDTLTDAQRDPGYLAGNETTMRTFGCADAAQGVQFELLDVGAQSVTGPQLGSADPGVALALSGPQPARLDYADLTDAIESYLTGYADSSCNKGGTGLTLAVGTNNDGDFAAYPAGARGADWASEVIDPLRTFADQNGYRVRVAGANDIEAAFASTEAQAEAWENSYLATTSADLIENGDANDCPTTPGATGSTCAFGWTQRQYYQLAHRGTRIRVLPQVFYPAEAAKWANIDATGGGGLVFAGALTQHSRDATQLAPAQGRAALYRAASGVAANPRVPFAVDI